MLKTLDIVDCQSIINNDITIKRDFSYFYFFIYFGFKSKVENKSFSFPRLESLDSSIQFVMFFV